jgi:hypothetical protein
MAEFRKLDGFQAKCLRRIAGIKHSYWSRVSNKAVRDSLGSKPLSCFLRHQQLMYLGDIARKPSGNVLRDCVFKPHSFQLCAPAGPRRRGRPRTTWARELFGIAIGFAGSEEALANMWADTPGAKASWQSAVHTHCNSAV